jgi:replicative DNA helicase
MTTAQKQGYSALFNDIKRQTPMGTDVAQDVLSKLFQQVIGEDVANLGFDFVNGTQTSMKPLRDLLEKYNDDFTPEMKIEWDDISFDTLIAKQNQQTRWAFNLPELARKVEGVNGGYLVEIGARPNTGKTSFHASMLVGENGFARQGAKCVVLCNEESYDRVGFRYLTASSNMDKYEIKDNPSQARDRYKIVSPNLKIKDVTGEDMTWVESMCKSVKPDVVVIDMGDKFARMSGYARPDEALKANAIYARQIAKQYDCVIFYMSQLSAEAEGRQVLNQAMMEGSRTGKAAEADLMILIGQPANVEGVDEQSNMRHLNVVKNKITGWHGMINCNINPHTARYSA